MALLPTVTDLLHHVTANLKTLTLRKKMLPRRALPENIAISAWKAKPNEILRWRRKPGDLQAEWGIENADEAGRTFACYRLDYSVGARKAFRFARLALDNGERIDCVPAIASCTVVRGRKGWASRASLRRSF